MGIIKGDTRSLDYSSYGENGNENGKYYVVYWGYMGLYRDNGKETGNYYIVYWGNRSNDCVDRIGRLAPARMRPYATREFPTEALKSLIGTTAPIPVKSA